MPLIGSNRPVVSRCESCIRSLWFPLTRSEGKVPPTLAGVTSSQHFSMISPKYIKAQSRSTSNTQPPSFPSFIIILCQGFLKFDIASQYFLGVRLSLQCFFYFSPALFQSCLSTTCCASTSHEFHTSQFLPSYSTCQNTTPKKIFLTSLEKSSWSLEVSLPPFDSTFIYSSLGWTSLGLIIEILSTISSGVYSLRI